MSKPDISPELTSILDQVKDPEVPVLSVVELGVVRSAKASGKKVDVVVTPTYSGCPAMRVMEEDIESALRQGGYTEINIKTVYAPAWTTDWMSGEAKAKLKAYGIAPPGETEAQDLIQITGVQRKSNCPWCDSSDTKITSEFGSTACKSLHYCNTCHQPFEHFKAF